MRLNKIILITILFSVNSFAEVIRFDVISLESPAFEGRVFGDVGQYQKITAKVTIAVDPKHVLNQGIVDIDIAPVNDDGFVEAIADVVILMPMDLHKGNKRIFYEVLNRGDKISLILLNDGKWNSTTHSCEKLGILQKYQKYVCDKYGSLFDGVKSEIGFPHPRVGRYRGYYNDIENCKYEIENNIKIFILEILF